MLQRRTHRIATLLAIMLPACGGSNAPPSSSPSPSPSPSASATAAPAPKDASLDVEALFARELNALPEAVPVEGAGLTLSVPGRNPRWVKETERGAIFKVDIGTEHPVQCTVLKVASDPSAVLAHGLKTVTKAGELLQAQTARVARAGNRAVWQVEAVYKVIKNGSPLVGHYKMVWVDDADRPVFCELDEVGYSKTITKIASHIAATMKADKPTPGETTELWARRMMLTNDEGGLVATPVGFERVTTQEKNGLRMQIRRSSALVSLRAGGWQTVEVISMTKSRPTDGALEAGRFVFYRDNQPLRVVELGAPTGGAHPVTWREGGGAPKKASLKVPPGGLKLAPPDPTPLLDGVDAPVEQMVYAPEVAPDRLTKMKAYRRSDGAGIAVDVGTWTGNYRWDAAGLIVRREWSHAKGLAMPLLAAGDDIRLIEP